MYFCNYKRRILSNRYLTKLLVFILRTVAAHSILSTMNWVLPGYSIKTAQCISLCYLVLGLLFLFTNKIKLLFVCFGCSAAISFLIHEMTNPAEVGIPEKKPWNQTDSIVHPPPPAPKI